LTERPFSDTAHPSPLARITVRWRSPVELDYEVVLDLSVAHALGNPEEYPY